MFSILICLSAVGNVLSYSEKAMEDKITNLPGAEDLDITFNQFSGYLQIPSEKNMHYWFVESMNNPSDDPIAFWTNGGPGCSGMIGFMTEMGPFQPTADLSLKLNDFAWNKIANMVYIEAPCGVGFSYADNKEDALRPSDKSTALDNYELIQAFFDRFPEYRKNKLYLTSESYGGHYLPTLSKEIVDRNSASTNPETVLNFKGFAVGNPYTTWYSGMPAKLETFWGHQLIDKPTWDAYYEACVKSKKPHAVECAEFYFEMSNMIDLNVYALDYPVCTEDPVAAKGRMQRYWQMDHMLHNQSKALRTAVGLVGDSKDNYEPCAEDYMDAYLNRDDVKAAIHVKGDIKWQKCSYDIVYEMKDSFVSMTPIYNYLIDGAYDLDILVYSGDDDSQCSTVGTQDWIWSLGYEVSGRMWQTYEVAGQTAGYLTKWKNAKLGFLTVHGAGHEVPTYKPEVALDMWQQYLHGKYTDG